MDFLPPDSCLGSPRLASFLEVSSFCFLPRFLHKLMEPGFYLISFWYKREESQRRFTVFWCSTLVASMFGGLLASAITNMDGVRGYSSWRWVFILEGLLTILIGIGSFFLVSDFPSQARWLDEDERQFIMARSGANEMQVQPISSQSIVSFFGDPKNFFGGLLYFCKPNAPANM